VAAGNPHVRSRCRSVRRRPLLRWGAVAIVAGLGSACGSSTSPQASSPLSKAELADPACVLVTPAQASTILGQAGSEVPAKSEPVGESSCTWHVPGSHHRSFDVFVNSGSGAIAEFRSSLAHPQPPVLKTTVGDTVALSRPASGSGAASSYVSAVVGTSLVSVEADGSTSSIANETALAVTKDALSALRSR
jgi:hypothetical protein